MPPGGVDSADEEYRPRYSSPRKTNPKANVSHVSNVACSATDPPPVHWSSSLELSVNAAVVGVVNDKRLKRGVPVDPDTSHG